jgi:hypothetical protein
MASTPVFPVKRHHPDYRKQASVPELKFVK